MHTRLAILLHAKSSAFRPHHHPADFAIVLGLPSPILDRKTTSFYTRAEPTRLKPSLSRRSLMNTGKHLRSNFQWIVLIAAVYLLFTSACSISSTKDISDAETNIWETTDDNCRVVSPREQQDTDHSNAVDTETAKAYTAAGYEVKNDAGLLTISQTRQIITTSSGDSTTVTTKGLDFSNTRGPSSRTFLK